MQEFIYTAGPSYSDALPASLSFGISTAAEMLNQVGQNGQLPSFLATF
jgi:hypothetical protein